MIRWQIDLAYDGADFHGWAAQPGLRTVQGVIESWLQRVLRLETPVQLTVAGRTDAGVHARGQVAHVDLPASIDGEKLAATLRRVLPEDIVLHSFAPAAPGFDARFSAIWRRYIYRLWDTESSPDPLLRNQVTRVPRRLEIAAMNEAASILLGLRDFAPFAKYREGASTIRELKIFSFQRIPDPQGTIEATVTADAFCHSMVRSLVGALTAVGTGQRDFTWLQQTAAMTSRCGEVIVMPAKGLCLEEVGYPDDAELAARATTARSRRDASELENR